MNEFKDKQFRRQRLINALWWLIVALWLFGIGASYGAIVHVITKKH